MSWSEFHFLRPWWFLGVLVLVALVWFAHRRVRAAQAWSKVCDAALLPYILLTRASSAWRGLAALALGGLLVITALAGPTMERLETPAFRDSAGLVIAIDLSNSMGSIDIEPNRLERVRYKVRDLLAQHEEVRAALVGYADTAFPIVPLTGNMRTMDFYLELLSVDLPPRQGSRPERALRAAEQLLEQSDVSRGDILLVTDYAGDQAALAEASALSESGRRIAIWGVGTAKGAPIAQKDGRFLIDKQGRTVIPKLDEASMLEIARAASGIYVPIDVDGDTDINALSSWLKRDVELADDSEIVEGLSADAWRELGPYLLLLLLPLSAMVFRRGVLVLALVLASSLLVEPVSAQGWDALFVNTDKRAKEKFDAGDLQGASELFSDREWVGYTRYRLGNYEGAAHALAGVETPEGLYNLGNAQAHSGDFQGAVQSYLRALKMQPDMDDAKANLSLVKKLVKTERRKGKRGDDDEEGEEGEEGDESQEGEEGEEGDESQEGEEGEEGEEGDESQEGEDGEQGEEGDEGEESDESQEGEEGEEGEKGDESQEGAEGEQGDEGEEGEESDGEQSDSESDAGGEDAVDETEREEREALENMLNQVAPANAHSVLKRKMRHQEKENKRRQKRAEDKSSRVEPW